MTVSFRNVDADPADPIETWPGEAIRIALERGGLREWRQLAAAIEADPWGPVSRCVQAEVELDPSYGVGPLMATVVVRAKEQATQRERAEVVAEIAQLLANSRLSQAEFAARIGTSAPRLSTYLRGHVVPSATLLVRMRRAAATALSPRREGANGVGRRPRSGTAP